MYDFHTHLNCPDLFVEWRKLLEMFVKVWWQWLVNIWVNDEYNKNGIDIAYESSSLYPDLEVLATIGYHPCNIPSIPRRIKDADSDLLSLVVWLESLYTKHSHVIVWIGECGIDLHYPDNPPLEDQCLYFEAQCLLAQKLHLPIIVHTRSARAETMRIAQKFPNCTFYFHCWSYGPEETQKTLELIPGCFIGYTGNITYKKADDIRQSCLLTPIEQCVLETDAPYLSPQLVRKQQNQPAFVAHTYDFVAELRWITLEELVSHMQDNWRTLYKTLPKM